MGLQQKVWLIRGTECIIDSCVSLFIVVLEKHWRVVVDNMRSDNMVSHKYLISNMYPVILILYDFSSI